MKKTLLITILLSLEFFISCSKSINYIIETDIAQISINASKNGLTVEEDRNLGSLIFDSIKKNTIGKTLPNVTVTNLLQQKLNLIKELDKVNNNFILVSSDIYCGFGLDCISNLFPKAYKLFSDENKDIPAFCLLKRTEFDTKDSLKLIKTMNELNPFYTSIYIIEDKEARKLNLNINPTRFYVNKNMIVTNIAYGIPIVEDLYKEMIQNTKR